MSQYVIFSSRTLNDNQTGVTYEDVFGQHLTGSSQIEIKEPYIMHDNQVENLKMLVEIIKKQEGDVSFNLITIKSVGSNGDFDPNEQDLKLKKLSDELANNGIKFSYEYDSDSKLRRISNNLGCNIQSDRGLHFYKRPLNSEERNNYAKRKCKKTEINYMKPLDLKDKEAIIIVDGNEVVIDNITIKDINKKQVRIKSANRFLFPPEVEFYQQPCSLEFIYLNDIYDVGLYYKSAPNNRRSPVIRLGRELFYKLNLEAGSILCVRKNTNETYTIEKRP